MNDLIIGSSVILNKKYMKKLINTLMAEANTMDNGDLVEITIIGDSIFVESEGMVTTIKLENQK